MKYVKFILDGALTIVGEVLVGLPILLSLILLWNLSKVLLLFFCLSFPIGIYLIYRHFIINDEL